MRSLQLGTYGQMIDSSVKLSTGYMQIHEKGYWEKKSINKLVSNPQEVINTLSKKGDIEYVVPRLEVFSLAASDSLSKGVAITGVDPSQENRFNGLGDKVVQGEFLKENSEGILIAKGLSSYLKLGINDTLVMIGQGYHGINAVGKYAIEGIIKHANPKLNKMAVYMTIPVMQTFIGAPNHLSALLVTPKNPKTLEALRANLEKDLGEEFEVMTWKDMLPEVVQTIESDNMGGIIMLVILYMVVGFGIFGTVMMMTMERIKEFGVLVAVGMKKIKIELMLFFEILMMTVLGLFLGIALAFPIVFYYHKNPIKLSGDFSSSMEEMGLEAILPFALDSSSFLAQGVVILLISIFCLTYPFYTIGKLKIVKALKG